MPSGAVTYTTREKEVFTGYLSEPAGVAQAPGILLITAIFGIDDEMMELADAWAADGFVVSVPDIFWRVMPGPTADLEKAFARYNDFDAEKGFNDVEDLMRDLRANPRCSGKVGVLGFCFGGRYAQVAASRFNADAACAYHGTLIDNHLDEVGSVTCPISFHFGAEDAVVPVETVNAIRLAYASHDDADIVLHDGADHNFSMPYKEGYNAVVAEKSRRAVLEKFNSMK